MPKYLSDNDFQSQVRENTNPVIIMFTGSWCQPCKQMKPLFEEMESQMKNDIDFAYMDIELADKTAKELNIRSVPSFGLFVDGMIREIYSGTMTKADLRYWINNNI